jgi:putative endopeptidase
MTKKGWGFDVRDMDQKVRPQDDFYHHAAGSWLKKNPIPAHESRWGSFLILRYKTEQQLQQLIKKITAKKTRAPGSSEQMIHDLYVSGLNMKQRDKAGLTPLTPWLSRIESIGNVAALVETLAHLEKIGGGGPWGLTVDQDRENSERYMIYVYQSGLGMPDRDYYLKSDAESTRVRSAYEKHIEAIFVLAGRSRAEAQKSRAIVMSLETKLAKISMTKEDLQDLDKTYHKTSVSGLAQLAPQVDWSAYFKIVGVKNLRELVVMQPKFMKAASKLLSSISISDWQVYLTWHLVGGSASLLGAAFEKEHFDFYGTTLSGVKEMKPAWRRSLSTTNSVLGELIGKLYVEEHFSKDSKMRALAIVDDLFRAYAARIKSLDWMSPSTKKQALKKLGAMTPKLGYPDKWRSYRGLVIVADDYFGNVIRAAHLEHARTLRKLEKPVDRKEWFIRPQTVNAYYSPNLNDVVFPAAILQAPYFSKDSDDALNYGSIGTVIGHEITHGFDDQGSKFDGKGNRKTWWTTSAYQTI